MKPQSSPEPQAYLDLHIMRAGDAYEVRAHSSAGEATGQFLNPFSADQLASIQAQRDHRIHTPQPEYNPEYIHSDSVRDQGHRLCSALLQGEILGLFIASYNAAEASGSVTPIRLIFDRVPELEAHPWEYLYFQRQRMFLSVTAQTPLIRYRHLAAATTPTDAQLPLRVLIVKCVPRDVADLGVSSEVESILESLYRLKKDGLVSYRVMENPTLATLGRELESHSPHVLHFSGHGEYDGESQKAFVLLVDQHGKADRVSSTRLSTVLRAGAHAPILVLNACSTASSSAQSPGTSMTQELIDAHFPAVLAMRDRITDQAACVFAESFYRAVASGSPLEVATNKARRAIFADRPGLLEWATPVLYLRSRSVRLVPVRRSWFKSWRQGFRQR